MIYTDGTKHYLVTAPKDRSEMRVYGSNGHQLYMSRNENNIPGRVVVNETQQWQKQPSGWEPNRPKDIQDLRKKKTTLSEYAS